MILRDIFITKFANTVILGEGMKISIFADEKMENKLCLEIKHFPHQYVALQIV